MNALVQKANSRPKGVRAGPERQGKEAEDAKTPSALHEADNVQLNMLVKKLGPEGKPDNVTKKEKKQAAAVPGSCGKKKEES